MNRTIILAVTPLCALLSATAGTGDVIRTAAELQTAAFDHAEVGRTFDIEARIVTPCRAGDESTFAVDDDTGATLIRKDVASRPKTVFWTNKTFAAGTHARIVGVIGLGRRSRRAFPYCDSLTPIGLGPDPIPMRVTGAEFLSGTCDCRLVAIRSIVRDIVTDEINPDYKYVILDMNGGIVPMPVAAKDNHLNTLSVGSEIEITGVCAPTQLGIRRQLGRHLLMKNIRIISNAKNDPFAAPPLGEFTRLRPQDIAKLGRHRISGRVIAAWHGDNALVKCADGRAIRIETDLGNTPRYGDFIDAVGFPESDLYRINLSRVIWRRQPSESMTDEPPRDVKAEELLTDMEGRRCFDPYAHGHAIRLRGVVRSLPGEENGDGRFNIESGKSVVQVDASATPKAMQKLEVGCEVFVAGTCVMEIDNWRPNLPFPAIRGFFVVVRRPSDVTVLSRPSWWTQPRLAAVVGVLLLVLLGSLIWNASLKRLAERRGRELAKTEISKIESELKVDERTRLAVELHDTISQNLTGISLAIQAADRLSGPAPEGMRANLKLAASSLDSCRRELKNCLWDLRNDTLDEIDMDKAISRTLAPHIGDAEMHVRFNVPRELLSDKTAHAILHILRELATNAIRHGHAEHIRIAGSIEGGTLRFSVRDDGCGFNLATAPGMDKGHFGLQGVKERVNQMEGDLSINSAPGKGTKVTIRIIVGHVALNMEQVATAPNDSAPLTSIISPPDHPI